MGAERYLTVGAAPRVQCESACSHRCRGAGTVHVHVPGAKEVEVGHTLIDAAVRRRLLGQVRVAGRQVHRRCVLGGVSEGRGDGHRGGGKDRLGIDPVHTFTVVVGRVGGVLAAFTEDGAPGLRSSRVPRVQHVARRTDNDRPVEVGFAVDEKHIVRTDRPVERIAGLPFGEGANVVQAVAAARLGVDRPRVL